ncbi:MAG TPA: TonB-dependent siderophore receptor [Steroidobacteraceae bacterium]|nr:TonB-dependent siderophore receptor [Steroidobacteraceae bacterium]
MQVSRRRQLAAIVAVLFAAPPALAQQRPDQVLPEVRVRAVAPESPIGPDTGYEVERTSSAMKTDTPLIETPQSVTVVTRQRIEDQGATSIQDALNYAAGVRSDAYGLDSRTDSVRIRGAYPTEYLDGLHRLLSGYYTSNARVDPYLLERIEVLRGPSSMLYGQGTTGGVLNMVSKRPLAEAQREIGVQLGSFERKQVQADLTGPLTADGEWLYRVVALSRRSDTQVDYVPDNRDLLAPTLTWRPSARTSLTLQAIVQQDHTGSTSQFFPWDGVVLPNPNGQIPTSRFIGRPGEDHYDTDRQEFGWIFEHRFSDRLTFRQLTRQSRNEVDYQSLYSDSFSNPTSPYLDPAQRVLGRFGYFEHHQADLLSTDQQLEGLLETGPVQHTLLLGFDTASQRDESSVAYDSPIGLGGNVPDIDVYSPVYTTYATPALAAQPGTKLTQTGVYLQDQMKLGSWIVVAGVRGDRSVNALAGSPDEVDSATSKRLGVMYRLPGGFVPYVSYSESFTPVAGTNFYGQRFEPLRGEQLEYGVKWESPVRRLAFNAAYYDLQEKNQFAPDPGNPLNTVQVGETHTHGLELELIGRVLDWLDVAAQYTYTAIDPQLEALPANQLSVWGTGRFALGGIEGIKAGLGVRYLSSFQDGIAPTTPAVTLIDGMLGYESGRWRYALNVQNLGDEIYVSTCLGRGDCWYGARRTAILSAGYKF